MAGSPLWWRSVSCRRARAAILLLLVIIRPAEANSDAYLEDLNTVDSSLLSCGAAIDELSQLLDPFLATSTISTYSTINTQPPSTKTITTSSATTSKATSTSIVPTTSHSESSVSTITYTPPSSTEFVTVSIPAKMMNSPPPNLVAEKGRATSPDEYWGLIVDSTLTQIDDILEAINDDPNNTTNAADLDVLSDDLRLLVDVGGRFTEAVRSSDVEGLSQHADETQAEVESTEGRVDALIQEEEDSATLGLILVIILAVIVVALILCLGFLLFWRKGKKRSGSSRKDLLHDSPRQEYSNPLPPTASFPFNASPATTTPASGLGTAPVSTVASAPASPLVLTPAPANGSILSSRMAPSTPIGSLVPSASPVNANPLVPIQTPRNPTGVIQPMTSGSPPGFVWPAHAMEPAAPLRHVPSTAPISHVIPPSVEPSRNHNSVVAGAAANYAYPSAPHSGLPTGYASQ